MASGLKVTVAGAGVFGLTVALRLADAGCQVTVRDPRAGASASMVAGGMIAPVLEAVLDEAPMAQFALMMAARDLWPALEARAGLYIDRGGSLAVGSEAFLARVAAGFVRLGLISTEAPAATLAPGLSARFATGLLTREDWRIDAEAGLSGLRAAAQAAGVTFLAEAVQGRGDEDVLVIAAGMSAGLAGLAPELSRLRPIKGHILEADLPFDFTVRGEGIYAAPTRTGVRIGATMEPGLSDAAVDPAKAQALEAAGVALIPALSHAPRRLLAGVRAATVDGFPLVGRSRADGVVLATGARRNGWLLAPLVAQIVVARVLGEEPGPWAAALDPARGSL